MIRLFLVVGVRFYAESLAALLPSRGSIEVVGTASGRGDARAEAERLCPDIVLLDAGLPGGLDLAREMTAAGAAPRVVVVAISEVAESVLEWAEAGVASFVPRSRSLGELISTIEEAARGEVNCPPGIVALILRRVGTLAALVHGRRDEPRELPDLTPREREIVHLMGRGLSNKRIALELGISVSTAKNHVHNILHKLNLQRRDHAAALLAGLDELAGGGGTRPFSPRRPPRPEPSNLFTPERYA